MNDVGFKDFGVVEQGERLFPGEAWAARREDFLDLTCVVCGGVYSWPEWGLQEGLVHICTSCEASSRFSWIRGCPDYLGLRQAHQIFILINAIKKEIAK